MKVMSWGKYAPPPPHPLVQDGLLSWFSRTSGLKAVGKAIALLFVTCPQRQSTSGNTTACGLITNAVASDQGIERAVTCASRIAGRHVHNDNADRFLCSGGHG